MTLLFKIANGSKSPSHISQSNPFAGLRSDPAAFCPSPFSVTHANLFSSFLWDLPTISTPSQAERSQFFCSSPCSDIISSQRNPLTVFITLYLNCPHYTQQLHIEAQFSSIPVQVVCFTLKHQARPVWYTSASLYLEWHLAKGRSSINIC